MTPLEPRINDIDGYIFFTSQAGDYYETLVGSRDDAYRLLDHDRADIRVAATLSFLYIWYFDDLIAEKFLSMALRDKDIVARYVAGGSLMSIHLRCECQTDRLLLWQLLKQIMNSSNDSDLASDISNYINVSRTADG